MSAARGAQREELAQGAQRVGPVQGAQREERSAWNRGRESATRIAPRATLHTPRSWRGALRVQRSAWKAARGLHRV